MSEADNSPPSRRLSVQPKTLLSLHEGLAGKLKRYEQVVKELPIEVVNEYRYTSRSVIPALHILATHADFAALRSSSDFDLYEDLMQQAETALRCGYHDLIDGLVYEIAEYLDQITQNLSPDAIAAMGDFRNEILTDLEGCYELIQRSRERLDEREEIYEEIYSEWFEKLLNHRKMLKDSVVPRILAVQRQVEDDRNHLLALREQETKESRVRHEQAMRWTIAGLIVTTVLGILGLYYK